MSERDFAYWLQGFFEMSEAKTLTEKQVDMIKKHLGSVFDAQIMAQEPSDFTQMPTITTTTGFPGTIIC